MKHCIPPAPRHPRTAIAAIRQVAGLTACVLMLAGCTAGSGTPPNGPSPTQPTGDTTDSSSLDLDEQTAAELVLARFDAVHGLPPTPADEIDVEAAGAGIVAPGSREAERVADALTQAIELGLLDRGDALAEALAAPEPSGADRARATLCVSLDLRTTVLDTGEDTGAPTPPDDWRRVQADYQRFGGTWLIAEMAPVDPTHCVPPSIDEQITNNWQAVADEWLTWERTGDDISGLLGLVTERFGDTLRSFPAGDPVDDPEPFVDFQIVEATRTTVRGTACRFGDVETVEWVLEDGRWLVDFIGQHGTEPEPCD